MPNGKTHDILGLATGPLVAFLTYKATGLAEDAAVVAIAHVAATYFLSPDLDMNTSVYRRWGWFRWIWWPYRKAVRHRNWLSHSGVSAAIRLLYLVGVLGILSGVLGILFGQLGVVEEAYAQIVQALHSSSEMQSLSASMLLGAVTADLVHVAADLWWPIKQSRWKDRQRRALRSSSDGPDSGS